MISDLAADFPERLTATGVLTKDGWVSALRLGGREVALEDVAGVYFRRPTRFAFATMPDHEREWALREARVGLGGLLMAGERWLNHPHRIGYAEYKPVQLALAVRTGLKPPRTIITSDASAARAFCDQVGEVVYKPMASPITPGPDGTSVIYTSAVEQSDLVEAGDAIAGTMHLFQERVNARHAVRITVVDGVAFAAAIHPHSAAAELDWRADQNALTFDEIDVPGEALRGMLDIMKLLGLRFGAFDFLVDADGRWVFLEVNPNGQWAFIDSLRTRITTAIADALTRQDDPT